MPSQSLFSLSPALSIVVITIIIITIIIIIVIIINIVIIIIQWQEKLIKVNFKIHK